MVMDVLLMFIEYMDSMCSISACTWSTPSSRVILQENGLYSLNRFYSVQKPFRLLLDPASHLQIILFTIPNTCMISLSRFIFGSNVEKSLSFKSANKNSYMQFILGEVNFSPH